MVLNRICAGKPANHVSLTGCRALEQPEAFCPAHWLARNKERSLTAELRPLKDKSNSTTTAQQVFFFRFGFDLVDLQQGGVLSGGAQWSTGVSRCSLFLGDLENPGPRSFVDGDARNPGNSYPPSSMWSSYQTGIEALIVFEDKTRFTGH